MDISQLTKGVASTTNAINVVLTKTRYMGGCAKDSHVVHDYIDPTMAPTIAATIFFGHLMPPYLTAFLYTILPVQLYNLLGMTLGPGKCVELC